LFLKSHPLRALQRFYRKLYIFKPRIGSHLGQCHKSPLGYTRYMVEMFWNFANMAHSFMALSKATTPCSLFVLINIINYCKYLYFIFENTFPHGRCFHHLKGPYAIHMQTFQDSKNISYITLEKVCSHKFPLIFQPMLTLETTTFKLKEGLRWRPSFIIKICTSWYLKTTKWVGSKFANYL
jgi:hypothetical protein